MQKSLQGLDNVTAVGAQAFRSLKRVWAIHLKKIGPDENWGGGGETKN